MESNGDAPARLTPLHVTVLVTVRLAHNLRNLLMIMGRCADSIRSEVPPGPRVDDDLAELDRTIDRAFHLTHELLSIGHPDSRQPIVVDVNQLVTGARGMIERALGDGIALQDRLEATTPHVLADPYELEWILLNLAMNGREAMPQGGVLTIETADYAFRLRDGSYPRSFVRLTVSDTGPGIQPGRLDQVSERQPPDEGAGFRLASVAITVEALNGWLEVDRKDGGGTGIHVDLPVAYRSSDA